MLYILYTISIILMIFLPIILAAALRRRLAVPWLLFCLGVATFAASQAVHLPLNDWLGKIGILPSASLDVKPPIWQMALVGGLTAGLCEELARAAGYAVLLRLRRGAAHSLADKDGLMVGLGHGGLESMIFGGVMTAATIAVVLPLQGSDLGKLGLNAVQLQSVQHQIALMTDPSTALIALLERTLAMGVHLFLSLMGLRAFQKRNAGYVVLAIAYHAVIDAGAVYAAQANWTPWLIEGAFVLIALPGFAWLAWVSRLEFQRSGQQSSVTTMRRELSVFWTALRKEMLQQVRTRRVLIIAAVFGLFGLGSPLIAYFTPQMLKAIPGAEQFANLVPTPTAADAMVQYIKNLTQFGFILALLLGMGEVAGEKERGTASMILSKPMTRSAFVLSKFSAQLIIYLMGFLLALTGAYFYTLVLFGSLDFGMFSLLNLALVFWLLPYVALTLLGSVLGRTTGAAAGIALGGIVVLMVTSSIPQIASLMPGALAGWASQLGSLAAGGAVGFGSSLASSANQTPAAGAVASSVVLALLALITSIGAFEQQEL